MKIKILLSCVVAGMCIHSQHSYWYFENKYYCQFSGSKINISMNQLDNWEKCLSKISQINKTIIANESSILKAQEFINYGEDVEYWTALKSTFENNNKSLESLKSYTISNMNYYEDQLFAKIYKLLWFYLKKEQQNLQREQRIIDNRLHDAVLQGNLESHTYYTAVKDTINLKITIIDQLLSSKRFDTLIPLLRYYFQITKIPL